MGSKFVTMATIEAHLHFTMASLMLSLFSWRIFNLRNSSKTEEDLLILEKILSSHPRHV